MTIDLEKLSAIAAKGNPSTKDLILVYGDLPELIAEIRRLRGDPSAIAHESKTVTVCDSCMRASCWQDLFPCDSNQTAGTVDMPVAELRKLNREHASYWQEVKP